MVTHSGIFSRHFVENEQNESVTSKKTIYLIADDKIWVFLWKLEFRGTCIYHCELDISSIF